MTNQNWLVEVKRDVERRTHFGVVSANGDPDAFRMKLLLAEIVKLESEAKERDETIEALLVKVKALVPHGTCGCSYDTPSDLCIHHSPQVMARDAKIVGLGKALEIAKGQIEHFAECYYPEHEDCTKEVFAKIEAASNG